MRVPVTAICLSCAYLASAGNTAVCERIREQGRLTVEQANKIVGPWAQAQFEEWRAAGSSGADGHFWDWLHRKWAPDVAESIIDCRLSKTCSPVTCQLIADDRDLEDQVNAYWTLGSITNYHNTAYELRTANVEAWNLAQEEVGSLVDTYSDAQNIDKHRKQHDLHWKIVSHIIITIALLASAVCTVLTAGAFATLGGELAVAAAAAGKPAMIALLTMEAQKDTVSMIGALSGLAGTLSVGAISFGSDFMHGTDYALKMTNMLGSTQKINHQQVADGFDKGILATFSGEDESDNSTLVELVRSGRYIQHSTVFKPEMSKILRNVWTASYISNIWNFERTYIVMADADGGCEGDKRGYKGIRVCLEEAPKYVFYVYFKSRVREGTNHKALLRGPPGYKTLEEKTSFTLEDVVRSSYVYAQHHGYTPGNVHTVNMVDNFFSADSIQAGGKAHGLFNIPLLYSPGGDAISSINSRKNRNYPCMAAALPWSTSGEAQSYLKPRGAGSWNKNDPETMFQFLNVTGLYQSEDWYYYCHGKRKRHGNHCKLDKAVNWTGKFGKGQIKKLKHPFKRCKSRGHGFPGCDSPKDNGFDENKPKACGGKGSADGSVEWYDEAVYQMEEMSGDEAAEGSGIEGYQSEWTDDEDGGDIGIDGDSDDDSDVEEGPMPKGHFETWSA